MSTATAASEHDEGRRSGTFGLLNVMSAFVLDGLRFLRELRALVAELRELVSELRMLAEMFAMLLDRVAQCRFEDAANEIVEAEHARLRAESEFSFFQKRQKTKP